MSELLKILLPALIAAAASIAAILITNYRSKRLTYFQTYSQKKLEAYSAFWAAEFRYERTGATEDEINLSTALHTVCLLAPLPIYKKALLATRKLQNNSHLSGQDIQELMDLMRLDLDECRRLRFPKVEPIDSNLSLRS